MTGRLPKQGLHVYEVIAALERSGWKSLLADDVCWYWIRDGRYVQLERNRESGMGSFNWRLLYGFVGWSDGAWCIEESEV